MSGRQNAQVLVIRKAYTLALVVWKVLAMACVDQMPHTLTLVLQKIYALTLCVWKAKCPGTRHLEGIGHGRHHPEATCLDTRRQEEMPHDTW